MWLRCPTPAAQAAQFGRTQGLLRSDSEPCAIGHSAWTSPKNNRSSSEDVGSFWGVVRVRLSTRTTLSQSQTLCKPFVLAILTCSEVGAITCFSNLQSSPLDASNREGAVRWSPAITA